MWGKMEEEESRLLNQVLFRIKMERKCQDEEFSKNTPYVICNFYL
ncbi:hypothetical protein LSO4A_90026 [Candidatus Liberibacter solanacearum]